MHLEALKPTLPTPWDPFGLLTLEERTLLPTLVDAGHPVPVEIGPKAWKRLFVKSRPGPVVNTEPVQRSSRTSSFRCDFHPRVRARWIVTAAPRNAKAPIGTVLCRACHDRRVNYRFEFAPMPDPQIRACCTNVMDSVGRPTCTGCATGPVRTIIAPRLTELDG